MYGMFWLLWVNLTLMVIVVSLISVLVTFMTVNAQNWEWWWRSFFTGASAGAWMGIYCLYAMIFELKMDLFAGDLIYIIYNCFICTLFAFACGFISVCASFLFLILIYRNSRSD